MRLIEKNRRDLTIDWIANAHPDSIVGRLRESGGLIPIPPINPPRPIRVYQCKDDCCLVQVPSKRFWYVRTPKGRETFTNFRAASFYAGFQATRLPQEVTP